MKQAVLKHWDLPWLSVSALLIFVICFAAYTYWTYRKANKKVYDEASQIPLEEPARAGSSSQGYRV
jgi:cbb3-type cytochrome oxidase subunit 3